MSQLPKATPDLAANGPNTWDEKNFIKKQTDLAKHYNQEEMFTRKDGLTMWQPKPHESYVIVPPQYAPKLVRWQHERMCHAGHAKVYSMLSKHFHWPNMRRDIRNWVTACPDCQLLKAKRIRVHSHFRANPQYEPRTSYGMDFYAIPCSKNGYSQILGIIDPVSYTHLTLPTIYSV